MTRLTKKSDWQTVIKPRGCFNCPEKVSTLEKVSDYRKLLIAPRCSKIVSKCPQEKTENDFEEGIRQTENGAFLDGNRRPDVEIRFRIGFYRIFSIFPV